MVRRPNFAVDMFWRLLIGTVVMLAFDYAGEAGIYNAWVGFFLAMAEWLFILLDICKAKCRTTWHAAGVPA